MPYENVLNLFDDYSYADTKTKILRIEQHYKQYPTNMIYDDSWYKHISV